MPPCAHPVPPQARPGPVRCLTLHRPAGDAGLTSAVGLNAAPGGGAGCRLVSLNSTRRAQCTLGLAVWLSGRDSAHGRRGLALRDACAITRKWLDPEFPPQETGILKGGAQGLPAAGRRAGG